MRLLLIAPDLPGVSWYSEIEHVTSGHHAVVVTGDVSDERLTSATAGQAFDVVHIASHASDAGVDLGGGSLMTASALAQIARHVRARLVFLNACGSAFLPQYLIDQHVPAVLAHTVPVLDSGALRLASFFYEEMERNGDDALAAYLVINPRNGTLSWYSNGRYVEERSVAPLLERSMAPVLERVSALESGMAPFLGSVMAPVLERVDAIELGMRRWLVGLSVGMVTNVGLMGWYWLRGMGWL